MNSESLILRSEVHSPLTTKGTYLTSSDFDNNNINIYEDFNQLATSNDIADFNASVVYDNTLEKFATYNGRTYLYVNASATMGNLPTDTNYWIEIFPTYLAHQKNRDTILDEGGVNETTASEIRAFIDAGLTSTTNLSISSHTTEALNINSSTGTDVTLNAATSTAAGLLTASNKVKLDNLSGVNTGDQTLSSLNAEDLDNKATDFSVINNVKYPTTEAVDGYLTSQVPTLVSSALTGVEVQTNKNATNGYVGKSAGKIVFMDFDSTFTSYLYNANTAGRTYTFQDRNGTIADDTDLALKSNIASPTFTGTLTTPAVIVSSETASTIASFDASKNVKSLSTATYPSLTELSYAKGVTSAIQTQIDNKSDKNLTLNRQTASYTLVASDNGKLVEMNVATANNVTINNSLFSAGNQILVAQYGAGQVSFVAGSGVTIRSASGKLKLTGQYSMATIVAISATEFYLAGDLTA